MATTQTLLSNLNSLLCNDIISVSEHTRMKTRILKAEAKAAEAQVVAELVPELEAFMAAGTQYKISDLVLGVLGIKAPCHGYQETADERKHRDGVAKPRIIAALELLGATKTGTGAQTRYSFGEAAAELTPVTEVEATEES